MAAQSAPAVPWKHAPALRGLHAPDAALRGTALEYLEATLPEALRRALWPRLPGAESPARPKRETAEIAEDLLRSSPSMRVR